MCLTLQHLWMRRMARNMNIVSMVGEWSTEQWLMDNVHAYLTSPEMRVKKYLLELMDIDGFIPIREFLLLTSVKAVTRDAAFLSDALRQHPLLDVSDDGQGVRLRGILCKPPAMDHVKINRGRPCCDYITGFCWNGDRCIRSHEPGEGQRLESEWLDAPIADIEAGLPILSQPHPLYFVMAVQSKANQNDANHEILELAISATRSSDCTVVGKFHRWVAPMKLWKRLKKGHRNFQCTAKPWEAVLEDLRWWIRKTERECGCTVNDHMFVSIGNWTIRRTIFTQNRRSKVVGPEYWHRWINLPVIFDKLYEPPQPFEKRRGCVGLMLAALGLPRTCNDRFCMDEVDNATKCMVRMMQQGAVMEHTSKIFPITLEFRATHDLFGEIHPS
eukprot:GGOE01024979.1.p1 GENE.GGOE01024979.1~~GGOE01024979.1.p1  ORF type:complete len:387 (-),score=33.57 GGOE01024979.1:113-1273(-)